MDNKEIGERIARLRIEKRFSREAMARNIGISAKFLYEIESGKKNFSVWILYRIAQLLSVSCDYLITGKRENDSERIGRLLLENYSQELLSRLFELQEEKAY